MIELLLNWIILGYLGILFELMLCLLKQVLKLLVIWLELLSHLEALNGFWHSHEVEEGISFPKICFGKLWLHLDDLITIFNCTQKLVRGQVCICSVRIVHMVGL